MSRLIESEIHDALDEIAPDAYDFEEQSQILAEATFLFTKAESAASARRSASANPRLREARMMDSLLVAMELHTDSQDDAGDDFGAPLDGRGLTPDQIVYRAARTPARRSSSRSFPARRTANDSLALVSDADLDVLHDAVGKGHDAEDYEIKDGIKVHPANIFQIPGQGHHRTDSQAR